MAIRMYGGAAAAVFSPLEPLSRAEQVERRLTDAIVLGLVPPDVTLPREAELALLLGVSTVTVREALKTLRLKGLVETRRGRGGGSFVREPDAVVGEIMRDRLRTTSTAQIRDLGDHYAAITGGAARLAAERATPEDVDRLRRGVGLMSSAASPGERRRAESHLRIEIAAVAQSPLLYRAEVSAQADIGPLLWLAIGGGDTDAAELASDVVTAIGRADGPAARRLTERRVTQMTATLVELRLDLAEEER